MLAMKYMIPHSQSICSGIPQKSIYDFEQPLIEKEFSCEALNLLHQMYKPLNQINIVINKSNCKSFNIEWLLIDSTQPRPIKGVLTVVMERE